MKNYDTNKELLYIQYWDVIDYMVIRFHKIFQ